MSNKIVNQNNLYYLTTTVVGWMDIFSRQAYRDIVIDSLKYCQEEKGLVLNAYVIMSNHLHLIGYAKEGYQLSNILRDFKKYTSKNIVQAIIDNDRESRKKWILPLFLKFGTKSKKEQVYQLWQSGNYPIELISRKWIKQKLNYIHNNPVKNGLVEEPEDYVYSSAKNYLGTGKTLLDIELIDFGVSEGFVFISSTE